MICFITGLVVGNVLGVFVTGLLWHNKMDEERR